MEDLLRLSPWSGGLGRWSKNKKIIKKIKIKGQGRYFFAKRQLGRLVLEFSKLGYQSACFSSTSLTLFKKITPSHTWVWWTQVLHKVLEFSKLRYQSTCKKKFFKKPDPFFENNPKPYPSLVDSGTALSTRVLQTRVLAWFSFLQKKKPMPYPSSLDSGTSHGTQVLETRVPFILNYTPTLTDANYWN